MNNNIYSIVESVSETSAVRFNVEEGEDMDHS